MAASTLSLLLAPLMTAPALAAGDVAWHLSGNQWEPVPAGVVSLDAGVRSRITAMGWSGNGLALSDLGSGNGQGARVWCLALDADDWTSVGPPLPTEAVPRAVCMLDDTAYVATQAGLWGLEPGGWSLSEELTYVVQRHWGQTKEEPRALAGTRPEHLAWLSHDGAGTLALSGLRSEGKGPFSYQIRREDRVWRAYEDLFEMTHTVVLSGWPYWWARLGNPPLICFPACAERKTTNLLCLGIALSGECPFTRRHPLDPAVDRVLALYGVGLEAGYALLADERGVHVYRSTTKGTERVGPPLPIAVAKEWSPAGVTLVVSKGTAVRVLASDGTLYELNGDTWAEAPVSATFRAVASHSALPAGLAEELGTTLLRAYDPDHDRLWVAGGDTVICHEFGA